MGSTSSGGATYYYGQDGLGSTTALFSTTGTLAATYTYDANGKLTATTGSVANPYRRLEGSNPL